MVYGVYFGAGGWMEVYLGMLLGCSLELKGGMKALTSKRKIRGVPEAFHPLL